MTATQRDSLKFRLLGTVIAPGWVLCRSLMIVNLLFRFSQPRELLFGWGNALVAGILVSWCCCARVAIRQSYTFCVAPPQLRSGQYAVTLVPSSVIAASRYMLQHVVNKPNQFFAFQIALLGPAIFTSTLLSLSNGHCISKFVSTFSLAFGLFFFIKSILNNRLKWELGLRHIHNIRMFAQVDRNKRIVDRLCSIRTEIESTVIIAIALFVISLIPGISDSVDIFQKGVICYSRIFSVWDSNDGPEGFVSISLKIAIGQILVLYAFAIHNELVDGVFLASFDVSVADVPALLRDPRPIEQLLGVSALVKAVAHDDTDLDFSDVSLVSADPTTTSIPNDHAIDSGFRAVFSYPLPRWHGTVASARAYVLRTNKGRPTVSWRVHTALARSVGAVFSLFVPRCIGDVLVFWSAHKSNLLSQLVRATFCGVDVDSAVRTEFRGPGDLVAGLCCGAVQCPALLPIKIQNCSEELVIINHWLYEILYDQNGHIWNGVFQVFTEQLAGVVSYLELMRTFVQTSQTTVDAEHMVAIQLDQQQQLAKFVDFFSGWTERASTIQRFLNHPSPRHRGGATLIAQSQATAIVADLQEVGVGLLVFARLTVAAASRWLFAASVLAKRRNGDDSMVLPGILLSSNEFPIRATEEIISISHFGRQLTNTAKDVGCLFCEEYDDHLEALLTESEDAEQKLLGRYAAAFTQFTTSRLLSDRIRVTSQR